jgi:hypothetical protein
LALKPPLPRQVPPIFVAIDIGIGRIVGIADIGVLVDVFNRCLEAEMGGVAAR